MKKVFRILLGVFFLLLLIGTFVFLWKKTRPVTISYEIIQPKIDTIQQSVIATGKVEPRDEVSIKPQISGIVSEIRRSTGDIVRKGDVIAVVKVIPDMASLNSAESRVAIAEINLAQSEKEFARTKELYAKGVVSTEEAEKSESAIKQLREELQSAQNSLEIVRNGVSKKNIDLGNTQIRSTVDGMILNIPVKVGNSVIQANTFNDGTTIATVANLQDMLFVGKVDETDVGKLTEGMDVSLTIGAIQDVSLSAKLEYVSPKAVESNGIIMFEMKAATKIPDSLIIRSGYSANAEIVIKKREGVLTLPENSILFRDGKRFVNVLTSAEGEMPQTFEEREIHTGLSDGLKIEILDGVTAEDHIRGNQITTK